jgi:hypothetical protein
MLRDKNGSMDDIATIADGPKKKMGTRKKGSHEEREKTIPSDVISAPTLPLFFVNAFLSVVPIAKTDEKINQRLLLITYYSILLEWS